MLLGRVSKLRVRDLCGGEELEFELNI